MTIKRHIIIPDTQVKPGVNTDHLEWAGKYIARMEPDTVIHLGDHWDMPSLSEYDKGKKSYEGRRYSKDIDVGRCGMDRLIHPFSDLNTKRVFLYGNHENRVIRAVESDAKLEGTIGSKDFGLDGNGWDTVPFLVPRCIDGIWYSHYYHPTKSRIPYSGKASNILTNLGFSYCMGHKPGRDYASRHLSNGTEQIGIIAGSFYSHKEECQGPQGNQYWRGIVVLNEVKNGSADPMFVSLDYLKRKFKPKLTGKPIVPKVRKT